MKSIALALILVASPAAHATTYLPLKAAPGVGAQNVAPWTYAVSLSGNVVTGVCGYHGYGRAQQYACTWPINTDVNGKVTVGAATLGSLCTSDAPCPSIPTGGEEVVLPNTERAWLIGTNGAGQELVIYVRLPYESVVVAP
jgi:hypothetical protein